MKIQRKIQQIICLGKSKNQLIEDLWIEMIKEQEEKNEENGQA